MGATQSSPSSSSTSASSTMSSTAAAALLSRMKQTSTSVSEFKSVVDSARKDPVRLSKTAAVYIFAALVMLSILMQTSPVVLLTLLLFVSHWLHAANLFNKSYVDFALHLKNNRTDLLVFLLAVLVVVSLILNVLSAMETTGLVSALTGVYVFCCWRECEPDSRGQPKCCPRMHRLRVTSCFDRCTLDILCCKCKTAKMVLYACVTEATFENNHKVLHSTKKGDVIAFEREHPIIKKYMHTAIYAGEGEVIHKNSDEGGTVRKHPFWAVALTSRAYIFNNDQHLQPLSPEEIVRRAESKLGSHEYSLLRGNCEHFTSWCRYDTNWSSQVQGQPRKTIRAGEFFNFKNLTENAEKQSLRDRIVSTLVVALFVAVLKCKNGSIAQRVILFIAQCVVAVVLVLAAVVLVLAVLFRELGSVVKRVVVLTRTLLTVVVVVVRVVGATVVALSYIFIFGALLGLI